MYIVICNKKDICPDKTCEHRSPHLPKIQHWPDLENHRCDETWAKCFKKCRCVEYDPTYFDDKEFEI